MQAVAGMHSEFPGTRSAPAAAAGGGHRDRDLDQYRTLRGWAAQVFAGLCADGKRGTTLGAMGARGAKRGRRRPTAVHQNRRQQGAAWRCGPQDRARGGAGVKGNWPYRGVPHRGRGGGDGRDRDFPGCRDGRVQVRLGACAEREGPCVARDGRAGRSLGGVRRRV